MHKVCTKIKITVQRTIRVCVFLCIFSVYFFCVFFLCMCIFLLNKTTAPIFQIIHIQSETLDPCVNVGTEQRRNVQTRHHDLFTF